MSARLARSAFQTAARRATPSVARPVGRRMMSSAAEGSSAKTKSDTPWIVGAALVFGPAFLYLVSPSARKPAAHDDKHDHPVSKSTSKDIVHPVKQEYVEPAPVVMTDDEGTEANVGASLALSEESDVPKDSVSPEAFQQTKTEAETEGETDASAPASPIPEKAAEPDTESIGRTDKSGTFKKPGEEGPTDMKVAGEAAQKKVTPKEHAANN